MRCGEFYELRLRIAMSVPEAKDALGFKPSDDPTPEEIAKAYKNLAFKHHPDRGGDPSKMVELNVAKDVLEGKQRPQQTSGPSTYQPQTYTTQRPDPPKPEHVSFEEAMRSSGVPTGVEWKFKTQAGYGRVSNGSESGQVIYGRTRNEHVFVAVYHYSDRGNMFRPLDIDKYEMAVKKAPLTQALSSVAPKIIRQLWSTFGSSVRKYNAKVELLKDGWKLTDLQKFSHGGRVISFKDAMQQMGESVPEKWKGKINITLELGDEVKSIGKYGHPQRPTLVVNGKEYVLGDRATEMADKINLYGLIWGKAYYYRGSRKVLTKMRGANKKKTLTFFRDICTKAGEPRELIEALEAALAA